MSSCGKKVASFLRMKTVDENRISRKRKRQETNIYCKAVLHQKQNFVKPRAGATNTIRRIIDVDLVIRELKKWMQKM